MENIDNFEHRSAIAIYFRNLTEINANTKEENEYYVSMLNTDKRDFAIEKLIVGNLKFALKTAMKYRGKGLNFDDLIAESNKALCIAAEKFDETVGKSFLAYAQWWIKSAISRAITANYTVRLSNQMDLRKRQVKAFINEFKANNGIEPTMEEIADNMRLSMIEVRHVLNAENSAISINQKFDDNADSDEIGDILSNTLIDTADSVDNYISNDFHRVLRNHVENLSYPYNVIIKMRYGIGCDKTYTLDEVADKIGKTKERARQMQNTALNILKNMMN
jgi:RNA polymerase primary sigma factor